MAQGRFCRDPGRADRVEPSGDALQRASLADHPCEPPPLDPTPAQHGAEAVQLMVPAPPPDPACADSAELELLTRARQGGLQADLPHASMVSYHGT